ncbi:MAG: phosphoribosylanthranilate isomerase [Proteobacteria bacterium]|nr:phosphoribosylanthranilate isomerase [Pseudomonadota bacterium]MCP4918305.1 phosphoribosylanthranilate isomerase [Pseudomonadota bacterium]
MIPVKVCCIQDEAEARLAIEHGARALGFVSAMPSGWGPIPEARIAEIKRTVPPFVSSVFLTSATEPERVADQLRRSGCEMVQLCDHFPDDGYAFLREQIPGVRILKAVHVVGDEAVEAARALAPKVDAVLLDTGNPDAHVKVLGGTGKTHDWNVSARVVEALDSPVVLAGGLRPDNVAAAVRKVRPWAIDLCTGVRTDTKLDAAKLAAFFGALRGLGE